MSQLFYSLLYNTHITVKPGPNFFKETSDFEACEYHLPKKDD